MVADSGGMRMAGGAWVHGGGGEGDGRGVVVVGVEGRVYIVGIRLSITLSHSWPYMAIGTNTRLSTCTMPRLNLASSKY